MNLLSIGWRLLTSLSSDREVRRSERLIGARLASAARPIEEITFIGWDNGDEGPAFPKYAVRIAPAGASPRTMTIGVRSHYGEPIFMSLLANGNWSRLA